MVPPMPLAHNAMVFAGPTRLRGAAISVPCALPAVGGRLVGVMSVDTLTLTFSRHDGFAA